MSNEISFLPEEMRKKEAAFKKAESAHLAAADSELRFSVPASEGEDVEIIEIDEGEVDQVLANEPWLTRLVYRATAFFDEVRYKVFFPQAPEPPPKLPPQFFTPPPLQSKPVVPVPSVPPSFPPVGQGFVPTPVTPVKPKPRIVPAEKAPRRVRVIKRVRKPVRVSFVSEEELRLLRIDVSKRQFTFGMLLALFGVVLAGGAYALSFQQAGANDELMRAQRQLVDVSASIQRRQTEWSAFQHLEPRLKALLGLLDQRVSSIGLLQFIEQQTLPTVTYDTFVLTSDRKITLGVTTDSYESAARQLVAFERSGFVKTAVASGYTAMYETEQSLLPSSVKFQLSLTLAESALKPQSAVSRLP